MSDSEQHPDSAEGPPVRPPLQSFDSMSSWEVISRQESTGEPQPPRSLVLSSPSTEFSLPDLSYSGTEIDGLDSIMESPAVDVVIRRPTLPSKANRRKLVSLLDTMSLHEYSMPDQFTPADKSVSTPDIHSPGCKSPKVARVRPVKRGESVKTDRPLSWTSRSLTSLTSLTSLFRQNSTVSSLESLSSSKCSGNYVFVFEG